ncbi:hypothetical protein GGR57DRAFT_119565 [Xylariaceae sp. FL1272]|nr:hypothetical protein GGR57DRAFT_119565 [Xylariaceae sp. FL1272]
MAETASDMEKTKKNRRIRTAKSILDYLTLKNPVVVHGEYNPKASQTNGTAYNNPTWMAPWEDFSFETMERIFDKKLIRECRDRANEFDYFDPVLLAGSQDRDFGEPGASGIIQVWTNTVVNEALGSVRQTLNPLQWVPPSSARSGRSDPQETEPKAIKRTGMARGTRLGASGAPLFSSRRGSIVPDGSGVDFLKAPSLETTGSSGKRRVTKLPIEIKSGKTWDSSREIETPRGNCTGWIKKRGAAPIRQIYTYCVRTRCRYGCIVTTKEAFLIRIRPYQEHSAASNSEPTQDEIEHAVIENGLLEHISIPWSVHRGEGQDLERFRDMTMNLALWFQHILAGNSHELAWQYGPLTEEVLRKTDQNLPTVPDSTLSEAAKLRARRPGEEVTSFISSLNTSFAHSDTGTQELPPPSGPGTMSYLNRSFVSDSGVEEDGSFGSPQKRKRVAENLTQVPSDVKKRGRGRPRKQVPAV